MAAKKKPSLQTKPPPPESYEYFPIKGADTKSKRQGTATGAKHKLSGPGRKPSKNVNRNNSKYGDR